MKACIAVLLPLLALGCALGRAQTVAPSITIGTHTLTLGMSETSVLEQLGSDLILKILPGGSARVAYATPEWRKLNSPESSWILEKKSTSGSVEIVGTVGFDAHRLVLAERHFEVEAASARSLFYAIDLASKSLEHDGFSGCQISTLDDNFTVEGGSSSKKVVFIDCGMKGISVELDTSDVPGWTPTSMGVIEWLHGK